MRRSQGGLTSGAVGTRGWIIMKYDPRGGYGMKCDPQRELREIWPQAE